MRLSIGSSPKEAHDGCSDGARLRVRMHVPLPVECWLGSPCFSHVGPFPRFVAVSARSVLVGCVPAPAQLDWQRWLDVSRNRVKQPEHS